MKDRFKRLCAKFNNILKLLIESDSPKNTGPFLPCFVLKSNQSLDRGHAMALAGVPGDRRASETGGGSHGEAHGGSF